MPIYEYSCKKCNEVFSVFQSMNASEKDTKCPKCGSNDVVKKISSFSCCSPASGGASAHGGFSGGG
ncbi:MAG: zinc ribbon domain-containing protein [Alphaproteobacteria bacterium]|uniref:Zinc ribbon domain-containing protein n=1 Tax=Candidatus Nitrobium versatile TaxID=2884831 RepID=A0A953JET3_9BACT|nr:zinc ribbon domain-containing protein [Candidatus Nitrobium versatile]